MENLDLKKYNLKLLIDFDSTFIKSESLEIISDISLEQNQNKNKIMSKIKELTDLAMNGNLSFSDALSKRIKLIKANKNHINQSVEKIKKEISLSFYQNKRFFEKNYENCFIISGGFNDIIEPVLFKYNIPKKNIFANDFLYNEKQEIYSINKDNPLSKDLGKIKVAQQIEGEKIIIGDGYTDYELKKYGEASLFIQHIENINRKKLNKSADLISNSLTDSLIFLEDYYGK
ncbi:MAG: hypothetical protein CMG49_01345 [Candidatus Marinimicrobia bacterium]|nr:hypothetical protein [Candidatus Neomarinimicrobiota bacterium]